MQRLPDPARNGQRWLTAIAAFFSHHHTPAHLYLSRPALISALVLLLWGVCLPVAAHNGRVALAYPVDGITVDGDLSDWPPEMIRHPIG